MWSCTLAEGGVSYRFHGYKEGVPLAIRFEHHQHGAIQLLISALNNQSVSTLLISDVAAYI